ncbi:MAG: PadR family transcriptional regulator [Clostridia bacterium]|nr:PadR family transcriptional regulator [Clostridia bacterium]MBQ4298352.1 PadR family transcriptional regulator [Clostridia bacterium]
MSITSDLLRGSTDTIILSVLEAGDSYGYAINKAVARATDGRYEMKEATLYTAFKRLEESGSVLSYWGDDGGAGARRRYYRITESGKKVLAVLRQDWEESKKIIDTLTKGKEDGNKDPDLH